jgi:4-amino-4-deoxychorismate lyase
MNKDMNGNDTLNLFRPKPYALWLPQEPPSRAALFGDGIFETMIYSQGCIRFHASHQDRVNDGIHALKLDPAGMSRVVDIEKLVTEHVDGNKTWRVRWNIFRSGFGKYTPEENLCLEQVTVQPHIPAQKIKQNAYFCTSIQLQSSPWSHCKTLNSLPYVMANVERKEKQMDEVILSDAQGYLSEAGAANLFWVKSGTFYTPSLRHHAISGVGRAQILQLLEQKGIRFQEGSFTKSALLQADQVFTSNVTGISYIQEIENQRFSTEAISCIEALFHQTP